MAVPDLSNFTKQKIWLIHGALDFENPYSGMLFYTRG
jgi:hypothetical protein